MQPDNEHNNLIIKYLTGQLTEDEKLSFESELEIDRNLREEVRELSHIYMGLDIYDRLTTDHIDSYMIAVYADNPLEIDGPTKKEIEDHLNACPDCREELELCRQTYRKQPESEPAESVWSRLKNIFFTPQMALKPAWVVALLILAAIPTYYSLNSFQPSANPVQPFTLNEVTRDNTQQNVIRLKPGTAVLTLRLSPPVLANARYDFELFDTDEQLILSSAARQSSPDKNVFAFEIPVSYFPYEGNYVLKVVEITETGVDYLESYYFRIEFSD